MASAAAEASMAAATGSDEEWLVQRAKASLKSDLYAAKSWLLTARTLYPRSFSIQFEAYNIEKNSKNIKEVAIILEEMMVAFAQEPQLWAEIRCISEALQSESTDEKTVFLRDLFGALPPTLQCHMLLQIAQTSTEILPRCRLMLLVLSRYPDSIPNQGVKLIDSLLSSEKHAQPPSPVNCYRKYFVCDVLPVVLRSRVPHVAHKHLYRWLQKSIEFYISYVTQSPSQDFQLASPTTPDLASPTKKSFSSGGLKRVIIPGLTEKESHIPNPWHKLFEVLRLVGDCLDWKLGNFCQTNASVESQWQELQRMYDELRHETDPSGIVKQVLYCSMALFMSSLINYSGRMDPQQFAACTGSKSDHLVLIEGFKSTPDVREHKHKKLKAESLNPKIHPSSSIPGSAEILQNLQTALKCWELLHSDMLEKEFTKIYQHWKTDSWVWIQNFQIDVALYQGSFRDAVSHLQSLAPLAKTSAAQTRIDLQIACCYFCLGNFSKACEMALNVISMLPRGQESSLHLPSLGGTGRQLHLLACTEYEILPYCIQLLITCFWEKAFRTILHDDMSLGHMIVLLQFDWPKYESLFGDVVEKIKLQGSFVYNLFFNYVVNIDILEEFAYIKTPEGGKVSLDILPTSAKLIAESRTVTRGVNKGVKEDFKVTMEKQVTRSQENVESVIRQFLVEERQAIQQSLL